MSVRRGFFRPAYFDGLQFPVPVLEGTGDRIACIEGRRSLLALIELEAVIGVGSWKRIKRLRLNRPADTLVELRGKLNYPLSVAASKTVVTQQLESGRRVHSFHGKRCVAYRQGRPRLDYGAL